MRQSSFSGISSHEAKHPDLRRSIRTVGAGPSILLSMAYYLGQSFGLIATLLCIIAPLWKRKWQMLVTTIGANLLVALNFVLIGKIGTAVLMNLVAVVQSTVSLVHAKKETPVAIWEKLLFLCLYVGFGILGLTQVAGIVPEFSFTNCLELMPIVGAVLLMIAVFQEEEQTTRGYLLANAAVWTVYDLLIGTTAVFAQLATIITTVLALFQNRTHKQQEEDDL